MRSDCGGLPYMVGLDSAGRDQHICPFGLRIGGEIFELACLVATERQRGEVVAFEPDIAAQVQGQAW